MDVTPQTTSALEIKVDGTQSGSSPPSCVSKIDVASLTAKEISRARNPSLQVTKDHAIKMADAPILRPGPKDVLLHVKVTGICGYVR
jgi:hypothetical protein